MYCSSLFSTKISQKKYFKGILSTNELKHSLNSSKIILRKNVLKIFRVAMNSKIHWIHQRLTWKNVSKKFWVPMNSKIHQIHQRFLEKKILSSNEVEYHWTHQRLSWEKYLKEIPSGNELSPLLRAIIRLITKGSPHILAQLILSYEKCWSGKFRNRGVMF